MMKGQRTGKGTHEMIRVRIPQKKKELEIPGPKRVMDILAAAGVRPTTVLVTQGKKLLTKDQHVEDGETVDIISVVSGG
jgi:sulfur carrier protein ThiS